MEYKQVTQTSRIYRFGEGEEFITKEEALEKVTSIVQKLKTDIALEKLYEKSEVEILEVENTLQIVWKLKIPILQEKEERE